MYYTFNIKHFGGIFLHIRTFGWIQNPSSFENLKTVVRIFDNTSNHYKELKNNLVQQRIIYFDDIKNNLQSKLDRNESTFSFGELVGSSRDKNQNTTNIRKEAEANSLIQISLLPQNHYTTGKNFTGYWTCDGFLRWAVSLNFVSFNRNTDELTITDLGKTFSQTKDNSTKEKEILKNALLSYPPATQVLKILVNNPDGCTKFKVGHSLGFRGESGFTSYDESLMIDWLKSEESDEERRKIRTDREGTSDKYARMICGWLSNLGMVQKVKNYDSSNGKKITSFQKYKITAKGLHAYRQSQGSSKNPKLPKFIMWEFLATKGSNRDYLRSRRAYIIKFLQTSKSFKNLLNHLKSLGFNDEKELIKQDILELNYFGINIELNDDKVVLKDIIQDFDIPNLNITDILVDKEREMRKAKFLKETVLDSKFISLLDLAADATKSRDFEIVTAELFKEAYNLNSVLLGGSNKPDGLVFTDDFGILLDTKAYKNGFSIYAKDRDQMIRYVDDNNKRDKIRNPNEWWKSFSPLIPNDKFYYLWVSNFFKGQFKNQIEYVNRETNTYGAVLNVEQLLYGADAVIKGIINPNKLHEYFSNDEIKFK